MIKVLMCCSTLNTKGGMVSVVKNYLGYKDWGGYKLVFIPTHFDTNKYIVMLYFGLRYLQIVFTVLLGRGYKIAHLHTAERGSFWRKAILVKTLKALGVKTVMHHHAAEFEDFYSKCSAKQKELIKKTLELTDVNIVLSERLVSMITDKAPKANVRVLYNAVNSYPKNPYNLKARNILFLGRLGERKGTFNLLTSIKSLDKLINNDIQFYLCGDGAIDETEKRVREMEISHRIAHIGWIDGAQKKEFLANTMINVLPSYNEGLPMTILETMAYGIPNISTNIASIPEVIKDGKNGFLIEPGDVGKLTKKIELLTKDVALKESFSKKSYLLIQQYFSLDNNIKILKEIYGVLLK